MTTPTIPLSAAETCARCGQHEQYGCACTEAERLKARCEQLLTAKEEAEGFATFWHEESRTLLAAKEAAEAEAAALRELVQAIADMNREPVGLADIASAILVNLDQPKEGDSDE